MSVYLDYNATTPLAPSVIQKITVYLTTVWGNPSSEYEPGLLAKSAITEARGYVANMIGASSDDIIFTSGGTESNNMVLLGVSNYFDSWKQRAEIDSFSDVRTSLPHVITTDVEHDAIILALRHMEKKGDIILSVVPMDANGCVHVDDIISQVRPNTSLITIMLANNETGVVLPLKDIGRRVQEINNQREKEGLIKMLLHTDAAQAVGKLEINVDDLRVDYMTIVGHKFYGPRIGCLYVRGLKAEKTPLFPLLYGGGQEDGYRPGTLNTPMIGGLGEAARLVCLHLKTYQENMSQQRDYLEKRLKEEFGDRVFFNCRTPDSSARLPNTSSVSLVGSEPEFRGHAILARCPRFMASVGAACHDQNAPSSVLMRSGVPWSRASNTIRLSVGRETTAADIDTVVEDLKLALGSLTVDQQSPRTTVQ